MKKHTLRVIYSVNGCEDTRDFSSTNGNPSYEDVQHIVQENVHDSWTHFTGDEVIVHRFDILPQAA